MTHIRPLHVLRRLPLLAVLLASAASAAPAGEPLRIDLAAEGSRPAANDLARASVFAEASNATPGELAKRVNGLISEGLQTARAYKDVKVQTGSTHTYPVYAKGGKIESWRIRSELTLESSDTAALSELLGKLQNSLGVASLMLLPAPATRIKAENAATIDAIAAFKARAKVIADELGKPYRIKQLTINSNGRQPYPPMLRANAMAMADAAPPLPIDAGDTQISVNISGQIELLE